MEKTKEIMNDNKKSLLIKIKEFLKEHVLFLCGFAIAVVIIVILIGIYYKIPNTMREALPWEMMDRISIVGGWLASCISLITFLYAWDISNRMKKRKLFKSTVSGKGHAALVFDLLNGERNAYITVYDQIGESVANVDGDEKAVYSEILKKRFKVLSDDIEGYTCVEGDEKSEYRRYCSTQKKDYDNKISVDFIEKNNTGRVIQVSSNGIGKTEEKLQDYAGMLNKALADIKDFLNANSITQVHMYFKCPTPIPALVQNKFSNNFKVYIYHLQDGGYIRIATIDKGFVNE